MVQLRPTFLQGCLISLGGLAFAFFGCLGAIAGFSGSGSDLILGWIGGAGFVAGALALFVGLIVFVIAFFRAIYAKRDGPT